MTVYTASDQTDVSYVRGKIGAFDKWDSNRFGENIVEAHKEANPDTNATVFGSGSTSLYCVTNTPFSPIRVRVSILNCMLHGPYSKGHTTCGKHNEAQFMLCSLCNIAYVTWPM